jgi:bifunctional DNA-binding transcriptional regulator/antitoxin component of YhaV-PrlF toxin-antitoxin module
MEVAYSARAHKQHNSVVVTIPKGIRVVTGIKAGDIIVFTKRVGKDGVWMERWQGKRGYYGERAAGKPE